MSDPIKLLRAILTVTSAIEAVYTIFGVSKQIWALSAFVIKSILSISSPAALKSETNVTTRISQDPLLIEEIRKINEIFDSVNLIVVSADDTSTIRRGIFIISGIQVFFVYLIHVFFFG